ncbi:phage tail protein, partial [Enterobacteriaceae bacterium DFI.7.85]|nr:phage tail protein [Enterobacteriaceae bacterium DFI.7.85]
WYGQHDQKWQENPANLGLGDIKTKLTAAMQKAANGGDIQDVVAFRKSLQLGVAALRNVGMGSASNLIDMDSVRSLIDGNGYIQIPTITNAGGNVKLYLQWGVTSTPPNSNNTYNVNVAFPNRIVFATGNRWTNGSNSSMNVNAIGTQQIQIQNWAPSGSYENCGWIAIGY